MGNTALAMNPHAHLTTLITSPSDLKRARRELEAVDEFLHQAGLRQNALRDTAGKVIKLPQVSRVVDELASETDVNLLQAGDRTKLIKYVNDMIEHAPVMHISFASEPSAAFLVKLSVWLRANIHPHVLVQVGLSPAIAAGCIVRTSVRQYDFSLTKAFDEHKDELVKDLKNGPNAANDDEKRMIEEEALREVLKANVKTGVAKA